MTPELPTSIFIKIDGENIALNIDSAKPKKRDDAPGTGQWYKWHDIALLLNGTMIGRVIVERIHLTSNRSANTAFYLIDEHFATDWELPLSCMDGQSLKPQLLEHFDIYLPTKAATDHIMITGLSILPLYRHLGLAQILIKQVALMYLSAQSIWLLPCAITQDKDDSNNSYTKALFETKNPDKEQLIKLYKYCGFSLVEKVKTHCGTPLMVSTPSNVISQYAMNHSLRKDSR